MYQKSEKLITFKLLRKVLAVGEGLAGAGGCHMQHKGILSRNLCFL